MFKLLSKREKIIFNVLIGLTVTVFTLKFIILPIFKKNESLNKEIQINRKKIKKYSGLMSQSEVILKRYEELSSAFKTQKIGEEAPMEAISLLEGIGKNANIRIIEIRPRGVTRDSTKHGELFIDLRAEGSMEGYLRFIYDIENSLLLLNIQKCQLTAKRGSQLLEGNFVIAHFSTPE